MPAVNTANVWARGNARRLGGGAKKASYDANDVGVEH